MLHVIMILLKIAGFIILFLLALLLVLLLTPFCYSFEVKKGEGQDPYVKTRVTWFIRGLVLYAQYVNFRFEYQIRFFGIQIFGNQPEFLAKKAEERRRREEAERREREEEKGDEETETESYDSFSPERQRAALSVHEEAMKEASSAREESSTEPKEISPGQQESSSAVEEPSTDQEGASTDQEGASSKQRELYRDEFLEFIKGLWRKAVDKIKNLFLNLKNILNQPRILKEYYIKGRSVYDKLHAERLIRKAFKAIMLVLRHIFPKWLSGHVRYGFDDPASTGYVTAAAATLYPVYGKCFVVEPDFFTKCFEADCKGTGLFSQFYLICLLCWLLLDKDVRRAIRWYRREQRRLNKNTVKS